MRKAEAISPTSAPASIPLAISPSAPSPEPIKIEPTQGLILPSLVSSVTPTFTPPTCKESQGKIIDAEVPNNIFSYPLRTKIYLPPCYSLHPEKPYPYVVLIHGMLFNYDQWDRVGADEAANELIASGDVDPFLIVMPNEERTTSNPDEVKFGNSITEALIPWMEENYPVCAERACRAIGGLSRGAGWAVHIGLSNPELFRSIGAHSLPPFSGDSQATPRWLSAISREEMPRVYIDIGIADGGITPARQFEQILTSYNVPHEWHVNNGEHNESYWSNHVKDYLRWYASGWDQYESPLILN